MVAVMSIVAAYKYDAFAQNIGLWKSISRSRAQPSSIPVVAAIETFMPILLVTVFRKRLAQMLLQAIPVPPGW